MTRVLFTLGYMAGWTPELVKAAAIQLDAIVVDSRMNASSRLPQWRKGYLTKVLGDRYLHENGLGNENYKGGPIKILDVAGAADRLRAIDKPLILMCMCKDVSECHRKVAAGLLRELLPFDGTHHLTVEDVDQPPPIDHVEQAPDCAD